MGIALTNTTSRAVYNFSVVIHPGDCYSCATGILRQGVRILRRENLFPLPCGRLTSDDAGPGDKADLLPITVYDFSSQRGGIIKIIYSVDEMQARADQLRRSGKTTAFVPTMGYLHEGHLSLLRIGKQKADDLVLSIFVNPAQFGPNEDLSSYPRSLQDDLEKAEKEGVDAVFVPNDEALYQDGYQTYVQLEKLPLHLCGLSRPVFFRGVTTVVTQLFNIVKPHVAIFGEKDFQQLAIIRQMVRDLKFAIEIVGGPIIREADGLAMSSRNAYLKEYMRPAALSLSRVLQNSRKMVQGGIVDAQLITDRALDIFSAFPEIKVDYISICDPESLDPVQSIEGRTLMALAVALEKIRLIDNTILQP